MNKAAVIDDMDLDLADLLRPGRPKARGVQVFGSEPLEKADLYLLENRVPAGPKQVKKMRERHHSMARMVAAGMTNGQIGIALRMAPATISQYRGNPQFIELVALYQQEINLANREVIQQLADLSADALNEIQERLEENPEDLSIGQLMEIAKLSLDRTGHGTSTRHEHNINVNLGERLRLARERLALETNPPQIIDQLPEED